MQWKIIILPFPEVEVSETFVMIEGKESITYLHTLVVKKNISCTCYNVLWKMWNVVIETYKLVCYRS